MGFVVYVNRSHDKSVIHDERCSFYQNRIKDRTRTGYWEGVFKSYQEALDFARSTGKKYVADCAFCIAKRCRLMNAYL